MKSYIELYDVGEEYFSDRLFAERFFADTKGRILEIGCSIGHHMIYYKDRRFGLDIDLEALLIARKNGFNVIQSELSRGIPFKSNSFSAIECQQVIEHLYDPQFFMKECYRILEPGGKAIIVTPDIIKWGHHFYSDYTHVKPFTKRSLSQVAIDSGFSDFSVTNLHKGIPLIKRLFRKNFISMRSVLKIQDILYSLGYRYHEHLLLVATK